MRRSFAFVALLGLVPLLAGCFTAAGLKALNASATAEIRIRSATLGDLELAPTLCESGERHLFLGADFIDELGLTTRLIVDPTGTAVLRFFRSATPLGPSLIFTKEECTQFELSLSRTGWQINDIHDLAIALRFDCRAPSGDSATGTLTTTHCH